MSGFEHYNTMKAINKYAVDKEIFCWKELTGYCVNKCIHIAKKSRKFRIDGDPYHRWCFYDPIELAKAINTDSVISYFNKMRTSKYSDSRVRVSPPLEIDEIIFENKTND